MSSICGVKSGFVTTMSHAGYQAQLMRASRLRGDGVHGLPPGEPINVFPIACLPGCPDSWVREAGTYVCPVDSEWGLWFNWTMNDKLNTAVVPSVKGMNPITGQKLEGMNLEGYVNKCPVHGTSFAHGHFCQECGYEWPAQNFVSAPNTLWWDGFRQPDGKVRQFFLTEDENRDVASAVIGKENTVPAFGFAFFKTKVPVQPVVYNNTRSMKLTGHSFVGSKPMTFGSSGSFGTKYGTSYVKTSGIGTPDMDASYFSSEPDYSLEGQSDGCCVMGYAMPTASMGEVDSISVSASAAMEGSRGITREKKSVAAVSVGAGAEIAQNLAQSTTSVDDWKPEPEAVIRLYFCFKEQFQSIVKKGGVVELKNEKEGFMKGIPVG